MTNFLKINKQNQFQKPRQKKTLQTKKHEKTAPFYVC